MFQHTLKFSLTSNILLLFLFQVILFLKSVIEKFFNEKAVWGSKKNQSAFVNNLKKFLQSRRFDKMTVKSMMENICIDDVPLFSGKQDMKIK